MNNLQDFTNIFDGIKSWAGQVPKGCLVNFIGSLTDARFFMNLGVDATAVGGDYQHSEFESPLGRFVTNDGVLTVRNPDL